MCSNVLLKCSTPAPPVCPSGWRRVAGSLMKIAVSLSSLFLRAGPHCSMMSPQSSSHSHRMGQVDKCLGREARKPLTSNYTITYIYIYLYQIRCVCRWTHSRRRHFVIFLKGLGCLSDLACDTSIENFGVSQTGCFSRQQDHSLQIWDLEAMPPATRGMCHQHWLELVEFLLSNMNCRACGLAFCMLLVTLNLSATPRKWPSLFSFCVLGSPTTACSAGSQVLGLALNDPEAGLIHSWTDATASTQCLQQVIIKLGKWRFRAETTWKCFS